MCFNLEMKSQSANISDNFHFRGGRGGGVICTWKMTKCQDLPKFQFLGGGGVICNWKVKVPIFLTIFISGGGGGGILYCRIGVNCRIWTKFSTTQAGSCITDSLSHTTYVETNKALLDIVLEKPLIQCDLFYFQKVKKRIVERTICALNFAFIYCKIGASNKTCMYVLQDSHGKILIQNGENGPVNDGL